MQSFVEIYPREGTETCHQRNAFRSSHVEIYPREGTETLPANHCETDYRVEIYPREGAETDIRPGFDNLSCTRLKFIPMRGRKPYE